MSRTACGCHTDTHVYAHGCVPQRKIPTTREKTKWDSFLSNQDDKEKACVCACLSILKAVVVVVFNLKNYARGWAVGMGVGGGTGDNQLYMPRSERDAEYK